MRVLPNIGQNCQPIHLPRAVIFDRLAEQKIIMGLTDQAERLSQLAADLRANRQGGAQ